MNRRRPIDAQWGTPRLLVLTALAVACVSCDKKRDPNQQAQPPEVVDPSGKPAEDAPAPAPKDAAAIASDEEIQAALQRWVQAQNEGDFGTYRALYAARFTGVKRAGDRVFRMGREDWLKDRQTMFGKPFHVGIAALSTSADPSVAVASFKQTWVGKTFRDEGTKQIVFLREGGRLQITREEMLSSETGSPGHLKGGPPQLSVVQETLEGSALLLPGVVRVDWARAHPKYVSNERAQRTVATQALPEETRRLLAQKYELFSAGGHRCEKTPIGFQILVHVVPHFGMVNQWEDFEAASQGRSPRPIPPERRALDLWGLATGLLAPGAASPGLTLALEFERDAACPSPVWGRKLEPAGPLAWQVHPATPPQEKELLAAALKHVTVKKFEVQARKEGGPSSRWFETMTAGSSVFFSNGKGMDFGYTEMRGSGGCSSENPSSIGLFFRRIQGELVPFSTTYHDGPIRGAVDVDGDGQPEVVTATQVLSKSPSGAFAPIVDFSPLWLDCSC